VGALDLVGNVLEWTNSIYRQYPFNENDGREIVTSDGQERAMRGGSYEQSGRNDRAARLSAIMRYAQSATDSFNNVGFRCARNY
jgi:iron(II)-dependent oxidoreductase